MALGIKSPTLAKNHQWQHTWYHLYRTARARMGYESKLSLMNPKIEWDPRCLSRLNYPHFVRHETLTCYGGITVPSDYSNPEKKTFPLVFKRYTKVSNLFPQAHVILLASESDSSEMALDANAERLLDEFKGQISVYVMHHRGLGGSGEFPIKGDILDHTFETLSDAFSNGPFDIKDLTMTNAALDVAMLGLAIKAEDSEAWLVLYGSRSNARWANHVVQLTPDSFDSAIFDRPPPIAGIKHKNSLVGLTEMCAKDEICRHKMGGDVYKAMKNAVRNLGNKSYNECTKLFHDQFANELTGTTVSEKTQAISSIFSNLLDPQLELLQNAENFRFPELLLPFLMATETCVNTDYYNKIVLQPMLNLILPINSKHSPGMNQVVGSIIALDIDYQDFPNGKLTPPADHTDLHKDVWAPDYYYRVHEHLRDTLKDRNHSKEKPAKTSKTAIYIMATRMDLTATYKPAWSLFNSITAPTKKWLLFDDRDNGEHWKTCRHMFEWEAIIGTSTDFDFKKCVRDANRQQYKLNLGFTSLHKTMWDCVPDNNDLRQMKSVIPVYSVFGEMREPTLFDKGLRAIGASDVHLLDPHRRELSAMMIVGLLILFYTWAIALSRS